MRLRCPSCNSIRFKKNGHTYTGKQNHLCKKCGRQFVRNPKQKLIPEKDRERIRKLLLERLPLLGFAV